MKNWSIIFALIIRTIACMGQDAVYQHPPQVIEDLVVGKSTPTVRTNSKGSVLLILENNPMPTVADLAEPEIRVAGMRINPKTNSLSRIRFATNIKILFIDTKAEVEVKKMPKNPLISNIKWSPDETKFAFTNNVTDGISDGVELWYVDMETVEAHRIEKIKVNSIFDSPYDWLNEGKNIVVLTVPPRMNPPTQFNIVKGPVVQESNGQKSPSRTYQDLLKSAYDQAVFDYYAESQVVKVDIVKGKLLKIGKVAVHKSISVSPDGTCLMTKTTHRPYSYTLPMNRFPEKVDVWLTKDGSFLKNIVDTPLQENIPIGYDAVTHHPRNHTWRPDVKASLWWLEAQDGGDPKKVTEERDKMYSWNFPFEGNPDDVVTSKYRITYMSWGNEKFAMTSEYWNATRRYISRIIDPSLKKEPRLLYDISSEDIYNQPGNPEVLRNKFGKFTVAISDNDEMLTFGEGASADGNRPFIEQVNLLTGKTKRLWQCDKQHYEYAISVLNWKEMKFLTRRESLTENPNYFIRDLSKDSSTIVALTKFEHPYPQLKNVLKKVLKYKRSDGIDLTAELYLPADYNPQNGPLPTIMWAYPEEYKTREGASQQNVSSNEFVRLPLLSPIYFVTQGYAVLDKVKIPIIGDAGKEANDSFIEQITASARAAIDEGLRLGVVDSSMVCIGGHSYGAFMTANLLTHTNLFKAGFACSGAYNRTLTPFGFQTEERNYWQDSELYNRISPFQNAHKMKHPLLLFHGDADNNPGTFTLQSERYFLALKGLGATTKYVNLPHESHGYRGKENLLQVYFEMNNWIKKYVINKEFSMKK